MTDLLLCDRWKLQLKHASAAKKKGQTRELKKKKKHFKNVTRCRIADQLKQRNKVGMIAVQYRTPPYISFHIKGM